jgi:glycosyltransferase involved in cell wall biosynthesis
MRIGIDARNILNPEYGDAIGAGHYTYQLIRHLLKQDSENEYVLFFDYRVRQKDVKKFTQKNVSIRFYPFSDYKKYLPGAYNEILGRATLVREKLDILHSTSPMSRIPASYDGKTITSFSHLGVVSHPELYPQVRRMRDRALIRFMARKSDRVIAVSQSLSDDLEHYDASIKEKMSVIHPGVDSRFFDDPKNDGSAYREKHGIATPYILYLGTLSPINNITRLLEAFSLFCKQSKQYEKYTLVVAGKRGWLSKEYKRIAKDFGVGSNTVFTGYVVGDDLVPLFKNSEFFVMPSLYEGFGSTVLEALATGTPTIASRVNSLPEVAGESAFFVDPYDTQALADAMDAFAKDKTFRESFGEKGPEQAKRYSWEKTAEKTRALYKELYKN